MYRYIFDIGGVLVKYNHDKVVELLAGPGDYDQELIETLFTNELLYQVETGKLAIPDFYENHIKRAMPGCTYDNWVGKYVEYFEINPEGFDLMMKLKEKGRKVYILSNLAEYHKIAIERKIAGFFGHCEVNFLSYEMGYYKPEPEIYKEVIETIGECPENLVFFDDLPQNINGAIKAGIHGIVFSNDRIGEIRELVGKLEAEG